MTFMFAGELVGYLHQEVTRHLVGKGGESDVTGLRIVAVEKSGNMLTVLPKVQLPLRLKMNAFWF